ncbi:hypothetical protein GCM10010222_23220 [Streptomyces tanashiensis]|nr:hypothetical protein GCM10010222_23220 [Streptomyces tanashiensis]
MVAASRSLSRPTAQAPRPAGGPAAGAGDGCAGTVPGRASAVAVPRAAEAADAFGGCVT